jgi:hypothetical protein
MNQGRDALICNRGVGQKDAGQRVALLSQGLDALIRDRDVGLTDAGQRVASLHLLVDDLRLDIESLGHEDQVQETQNTSEVKKQSS